MKRQKLNMCPRNFSWGRRQAKEKGGRGTQREGFQWEKGEYEAENLKCKWEKEGAINLPNHSKNNPQKDVECVQGRLNSGG